MRLLYLELPRYGPLENVAVAFRQESVLTGREGALNFVVGLNGTGKSSLLRAVFEVFQALDLSLEKDALPKFPVRMAFRSGPENAAKLVMFDHPANAPREATRIYLQVLSTMGKHFPNAFDNYSTENWRESFESLRAGKNLYEGQWVAATETLTGDKLQGEGRLRAVLPKQVLAYTSGEVELWLNALQTMASPANLEVWGAEGERAAQRPKQWNLASEATGLVTHGLVPGVEALTEPARVSGIEMRAKDAEESGVNVLEGVVARYRAMLRKTSPTKDVLSRCTLLQPEEVRLIGVALGLTQAAKELHDCPDEASLQALHRRLAREVTDNTPANGTRRLFNAVRWLWPTHLSLVVNHEREPSDAESLARLFTLHALAEEAVWQPLDRRRLVIELGPRFGRSVEDVAKKHFGLPEEMTGMFAQRVDGAKTGAEAFAKLFSLEGELWPMIETLRAWRQSGYLEDINLTVRRVEQTPDEKESEPAEVDGEGQRPRETVLTYDAFSDGEHMLLERMALLFLLQGQHDTLLLLDEPETHFNDSWKREIVDLIDDNLLKTTSAHVLVATHTSIALTDVFRSEVFAMERDRETGQARERVLTEATFGATPGEIMRRVFGTDDTVGRRAMEFLDAVLVLTAYPDELARVWNEAVNEKPAKDSRAFTALCAQLKRHPQVFGEGPDHERVWAMLKEFRALVDSNGTPADAMRRLADNIGSGHYQFEFKRRVGLAAQK